MKMKGDIRENTLLKLNYHRPKGSRNDKYWLIYKITTWVQTTLSKLLRLLSHISTVEYSRIQLRTAKFRT